MAANPPRPEEPPEDTQTELEAAGLVKRRRVSRSPTQPYHTYVKLPTGEDSP